MTKQLFAKVGVFALIGVNLGAYYVFWPDTTPRGPESGGSAAGRPDRLEPPGKSIQLASTAGAAQTADKSPFPTFPGSNPPTPSAPPAAPVDNGLPAIPPVPGGSDSPPPPRPFEPVRPVKGDKKGDDPTIELLKKLKERTAQPVEPTPPGPGPGPVPAAAPKKKDGVQQAAVSDPAPVKPSGTSPWSLQVELAGGQKMLTAKLHRRTEFRIACDQVEMKTTDGAVAAVGKVTFTAPGLKGACQRLTIGLEGDSIVLEGKAELQVQQGGAPEFGGGAAELKGERLTLRLQPSATGILPTNAWPAASPITPLVTSPTPSTPVPSTPTPFPAPRPFPLLQK